MNHTLNNNSYHLSYSKFKINTGSQDILSFLIHQSKHWINQYYFHLSRLITHCKCSRSCISIVLESYHHFLFHSLGADVIYDPSCLPHLIRVLYALLKHGHSHPESGASLDSDTSDGKKSSNVSRETDKRPVAYIASVIRNVNTFNYFLALAEQAKLAVTDLTELIKVSDFLPYMRSYDRSSVRMFKIHV